MGRTLACCTEPPTRDAGMLRARSSGSSGAAGLACASRAPLRWGPNFVDELAERSLSRLSDVQVAQLTRWLHGAELGWGSGCSGTDSPAWVFRALKAQLEHRACRADFPQVFSAEADKRKRGFILETGDPEQLFACIYDLGLPEADCCKSLRRVLVDERHRLRLFIAGFSCKTVSGLHQTDRDSAEQCITDGTGTTGFTFNGVLLVLSRRNPKFFILENVCGLQRSGQLEIVLAKLERVGPGYVVAHRVFNPKDDAGIPQDRPRIYICGWNKPCAGACSAAFVQERFSDIADKLGEGHGMMDVDGFLYDETHPTICERRERFRARVREGARFQQAIGGKWVRRQELMRERKQGARHPSASAWDPSFAMLYPEVELLPARELGLLDMRGIRFPHQSAQCLNTSQSDASGGEGYVSTLTPQGRFWLAHRCRHLLGAEALSFQGIYIDPDTVSADDRLLHDLAGNAFNTASFMHALIALLAIAAELDDHGSKASGIAASGSPSASASFGKGARDVKLASGKLLSESDSDSESEMWHWQK